MTQTSVVGVIVNPVAGIGGRLALHGSDGSSGILARERGGVSVSPQRMSQALRVLLDSFPTVRVLAAAGEMGARVVQAAGVNYDEILVRAHDTTAADTRSAAVSMRDSGANLIIFAGGDGTARDILEAVGGTVPIIGVPAGVKMHSAVFAVHPGAAGAAAAAYLADPVGIGTVEAEIADVQSGEQAGSVTIFGVASVPRQRASLQSMKSGPSRDTEADLAALGREVAGEMQPGRLYLLGPGTTVAYVETALGVEGSVVGVDAVLDGVLIATDAAEEQLLDLIGRHPSVTLILGVIGGQGFLLGRGNQQISGRVLAAIGAANIAILASENKIASLDPPVLRIDLDDDSAAGRLTGYRRVRTRPRHSTVLKVVR